MNDDLISRKAAIDVCNYAIDLWHGQLGEGIVIAVRKRIEELPSAQPEVIRCKDCKYRDENWRRVSVKWLPCMEIQTGDKWYCGSAERRENG